MTGIPTHDACAAANKVTVFSPWQLTLRAEHLCFHFKFTLASLPSKLDKKFAK